jgi:hypothetical protein
MQRTWVLAILVASGLLAQTPPTVPPPAPVQAPAPELQPAEVKAEAPSESKPDEQKPVEAKVPEAKSFDQLRPSQRKLAYTLNRAALSAHELGYYRSHPRTIEVREALEALVMAKLEIPEKAQTALPAAEAYLAKLRANHGLYEADGKKLILEGSWKDLRMAARAAAKTGPKGLEPRLLKLKGLLYDPKVDAVAPTWAEPEPPAKGKRKAKAVKGPKAPEGFAAQKAILALWVKRAGDWIENTPQEVEVKGEKKIRRMPEPTQTKALNDLSAWLNKDDLDLLRDPGFGWLDLRRLGAVPGAGLLARAADIAASKAPEGPVGESTLLPTFEPVMGESKFIKGEEKRAVLAEVKQGAPAASLQEQSVVQEKLGRSRDYETK